MNTHTQLLAVGVVFSLLSVCLTHAGQGEAGGLERIVGSESAATAEAPINGAVGVQVLRLPSGGIQPHAVVDEAGAVHVVYLVGKAAACDVYYARRRPGGSGWDTPMRVNSQPGSAVAVGTIRGPRMALGREGRVHVAWNGSSVAAPRGPKDSHGKDGEPMLYARLNNGGVGYEPQRCVAHTSTGLDGGGSIAADAEGRVFVGWHAAGPEGPASEAARRFVLARSTDDGATFGPERPVSPAGLGACACCGTAALADSAGDVHFLFRTAAGDGYRNMEWLSSSDHGESFTARRVHSWKIDQCPMSSAWISTQPTGRDGVVCAWETDRQVYFQRSPVRGGEASPPVAPSGEGESRKHPAVAVDKQGRVLLVWTEGTGWNKGGSAAWEVFDTDDKPVQGTRALRQGAEGIAVWNSVAAVAAGDAFFVVY